MMRPGFMPGLPGMMGDLNPQVCNLLSGSNSLLALC